MVSIKVIVARYNEDLSWINDINHEVIVFNKNSNDESNFEYNLPNFGREGHTFINYIVVNYESLPDYLVFLQGNPFDHCPNVIDIINNFDYTNKFIPLGNTYTYYENPTYDSIDEQMKNFAKNMGFDLIFPVTMVPGAQYIISKDIILRNPKELYERIRSSMDHELYPQAVLDLEKTLFQVYKIYDISKI